MIGILQQNLESLIQKIVTNKFQPREIIGYITFLIEDKYRTLSWYSQT